MTIATAVPWGAGSKPHSLAVNQQVVAEGVAGLQVIGLGVVCLLVSLDQEAGAVLHDHHCRWVETAAATQSTVVEMERLSVCVHICVCTCMYLYIHTCTYLKKHIYVVLNLVCFLYMNDL